MFKKIIFFFAWVGMFVISLISLNYVLLPGQLFFNNPYTANTTTFEYKLVVLVLASLYIFICLCKFFSLFERKKDYERKTENGTLKISRATINNYVTDLLRKDPDITGIKTTSELKGNKFLIYNTFITAFCLFVLSGSIGYVASIIILDFSIRRGLLWE